MYMRTSTAMATECSVSSLSSDAPELVAVADLSVSSDLVATGALYVSSARATSRLTLAEGAVALTLLYALIGAGIGAAAGSLLLGLGVGFATGVAAVAAILLISGASAGAERHVDRVISGFPSEVSRS